MMSLVEPVMNEDEETADQNKELRVYPENLVDYELCEVLSTTFFTNIRERAVLDELVVARGSGIREH